MSIEYVENAVRQKIINVIHRDSVLDTTHAVTYMAKYKYLLNLSDNCMYKNITNSNIRKDLTNTSHNMGYII